MVKSQSTISSLIGYRITGESNTETIVFLHGLGSNLEQFRDQHTFFSDNYQVISINLSGHGNSTSQAHLGLANNAKDVIDLMNILGVDRFHLVGNSLGGNVGYEILSKHENRLLSFTTFGTTAVLSMPKTVAKMLAIGYRLLGKKVISFLAAQSGQNSWSRAEIRKIMAEANIATVVDLIPEIARFDYLNVIANSHVKAMIMRGSKDKEINKNLNSTLSVFEQRGHFKLVEMPSVGHFSNLDAPSLFNKELLKFLEGTET